MSEQVESTVAENEVGEEIVVDAPVTVDEPQAPKLPDATSIEDLDALFERLVAEGATPTNNPINGHNYLSVPYPGGWVLKPDSFVGKCVFLIEGSGELVNAVPDGGDS